MPEAFDWLKGAGVVKTSTWCEYCNMKTNSEKHGVLIRCEICQTAKGVMTNEDKPLQ